MIDPRAENCRGLAVDANGLVSGVELQFETRPETAYELLRAELIGEEAAKGQTVATCVVLDENGVQTAESVVLAWPWPVLGNTGGMGNQNGQHMITNGYTPPDIGPLALYVAGAQPGIVNSDIIGGLGLPSNRHVSFRVTWRKRGAPNTGGGDSGSTDLTPVLEALDDLQAQMASLAVAVAQIRAHFK